MNLPLNKNTFAYAKVSDCGQTELKFISSVCFFIWINIFH